MSVLQLLRAARRRPTVRRRRGWRRYFWLTGPALALVVFGAPTLWLWWVASRAERCFATIPNRTEAALPDCAARAASLDWLVDLPFIGRPALRAREEIVARMAAWRYLDAAVGEPDRAALAERLPPLWEAEKLLWDGSARLRMDEVGPPMPIPEPGQLAFSAGDRQGLDDHGFRWTQHYTEIRAMEAVLLDGKLERAVRLAQHYAGRPPSDLRMRVAALLCLGGEHQRGLEQIVEEEESRADDRSANFWRSFGDLRVVIEGCAALAGKPAPEAPVAEYAGALDQRARLMALRLRQLRRRHPGCDLADLEGCRKDPAVLAELDRLESLLGSTEAQAHRLALLAEAADTLVTPAVARRYARPLAGEPSPGAALVRPVEAWLGRAPDAPFAPAERFAAAADELAVLVPGELRPTTRALAVRAAMSFAARGELARADARLTQAAVEPPVAALLSAQAALLAADVEAARARAATGAAIPELSLLRAELALPDAAEAERQARAVLADARADADTLERARWLLLSLGVVTRGREVIERAAPPPRLAVVGAPNDWLAPEVRQANLDDALAQLHVWLGADNPRAARYALFDARGDAPTAFAAWLHAGQRLARAPGAAEIWLDAWMAFDTRRFTLRQVAFARWRVALWRADGEAAAAWLARYQKLVALAEDPERADLLLSLGV